jgi:hypothetical protein
LKALDNYILSDEEIIEGADVKESPFHSFSPQLRINLNPSDKSIQSSSKLINRINYTVKHCSPVHIIQRFTRGYLKRKHLSKNENLSKILKRSYLMNTRVGKRNLLSTTWKFEKGKVDINYSKLPLLVKEAPVTKSDNHFLDLKLFSDLTPNDLDSGLKGKEEKLHLASEMKHGLKKIKADLVTESTKALYNETMFIMKQLRSVLERAPLKNPCDDILWTESIQLEKRRSSKQIISKGNARMSDIRPPLG